MQVTKSDPLELEHWLRTDRHVVKLRLLVELPYIACGALSKQIDALLVDYPFKTVDEYRELLLKQSR